MSAHFTKKALTAVALIASLASISNAFAHAHLKSEIPAADSSVTAPKDLRLNFSEGVEAQFTKVNVTDDGKPVAIKAVETEPNDKKLLIVTPEQPLKPGSYKVEWYAVSVDTHKSEGHYTFKITD
ncbi:copper homeostasis periplasmic binding protein CopC [Pseudomonas gingeri]|uniref:copper homeostasis periplasmic binding protein CopC n=1 Tax=Pseudomonas gingeri TaxID=117681 RepID=UPI0015A066D5|nr:copper homeostasis periplasmic binding protein CopC [Pseudomonas gingeri]NWA26439.1 copper homeostasis periplasmic binding protein CopC [Pseudomonas gingeri]NWD67953.1 copper homeostasis periplasmic binding protein CopC [Pseudomonas gingeri]